VPAEVAETQAHMQPVVILERLNLARYVTAPENLRGFYLKLALIFKILQHKVYILHFV